MIASSPGQSHLILEIGSTSYVVTSQFSKPALQMRSTGCLKIEMRLPCLHGRALTFTRIAWTTFHTVIAELLGVLPHNTSSVLPRFSHRESPSMPVFLHLMQLILQERD